MHFRKIIPAAMWKMDWEKEKSMHGVKRLLQQNISFVRADTVCALLLLCVVNTYALAGAQ